MVASRKTASRVVGIATLLCAMTAALLLLLTPKSVWSQGLASYSVTDFNNGTFTAGAVTGTITVSSRTNVTAGSGLVSGTAPSGSNFPGSWYSPAAPALADFQRFELSSADGTNTGSYTVTYQFDTPVTNPVFYFYNADAGTFNFSSTTQVGGGAVSLTRLSGNNELELTGSTVNSTPRTASNTGCEANNGTNGQGACGSIQLTGIYQTVTFVGTDTTTSNATGDGHAIALYVYSDYGDAPSTYGSAAHSGSTAIRLGANRDVESGNLPSAGATLDDTTGTDDEDALSSVSGVTLSSGGTHTQSSISCTGTAAMYGYIDFNRDGDFADSGEQSALTSCSGGTTSLSWTMSSTPGALVAGASFLRIRYATASSEISSPTGNATTGEVEDYPVTLSFPAADFAVTKTDGITSIASGNSTTYTVVVTNNGPSTVTGAILTDAAATGLTKVSVACASTPGVCTSGTTPTISQLEAGYALPAMASSETYRLTISAVVTAASGNVSNIAAIAVPSGFTDGTSGNNSATDTNSVTARTAGTPPTLSCPNGTTIHDWTSSVSWPAGSLNNNYSVSNLGTINFSIATTGGAWVNNATYGGTSPTLQNIDSYGITPAPYSLLEWINFANTSEVATTTITLPTAVPGMQFRIFDIDYGASSFADKLTVTGTFNGASVTPTLTNGVSNYVIGNTAYGDVAAADTSTNGTIYVTFSQPVDTITITYGNHSLAPSNPTGQAMAIDDLNFCRPVANLSVTKISSVLSDNVSATNPKAIPGATIRYCITVSNGGSGTATSVSATDTLPPDVTYVPNSMESGASCGTAGTAEDDDATGADDTDTVGMSISGSTITGITASLAPNASFAMVFNAIVD